MEIKRWIATNDGNIGNVVIPGVVPSDPQEKQWYDMLVKFVQDAQSAPELSFEASLSADERRRLHALADQFALAHSSRGEGGDRHVVVQKRGYEFVFQGGYIGLFGPKVDLAGQSATESVPDSYKQKRVGRDGNVFHLTIALKRDFAAIMKHLPQSRFAERYAQLREKYSSITGTQHDANIIMDLVAENVRDDWKDLGLGRIVDGDNETYYKVVRWESAAQFRKDIGLGAQYWHITVGFRNQDIHGVKKDESTLISG